MKIKKRMKKIIFKLDKKKLQSMLKSIFEKVDR